MRGILYIFIFLFTGINICLAQTNQHTHVRVRKTNLISIFEENGFVKTPDQISNLWLWLDGGDTTTIHTNSTCNNPITATGDRVGCWADKSPNGFNFTQPTASKRPEVLLDTLNGIANAINFVESSKDILEHDLIPAEELNNSDFTYFMVFRANVVLQKNNAALFSSSDASNLDGSWEMDFKNTFNNFNHTTRSGGGSVVAPFDANVLDIKLYNFTYDNLVPEVLTYVDGTQQGASNPLSLVTTHMKLGVNRQGSTFADAQIAEVIAYDRKLGICEINEVILYLSIKYDQSSFQPIPVPGGVDCSQLFFWLRTDVGTSTTTDGVALNSWKDKAFSNRDLRQPVAANQPIYRNNPTANINFRPVIDFDGVNDFLFDESVVGNTNHLLTMYMVAKEDTRKNNEALSLRFTAPAGNRVLVQHPNAAGNLVWDAGTSSVPERISGAAPFPVGQPSIVRYLNDTVTKRQEIHVNGVLVASDVTARYLTNLDSTVLGGITNFYDGKIPEILIYETTFSTDQINNLDTYLAIKYGITLGHNYFDTDTNLIYNISNGYGNGIFGVGKDLITALDQRRSKSQNLNEAVTIALTIDIADKQFLVSGHNGAALTRITVGGYTNVLTRKWFAKMTGNVGTVNMELDLAAIGANTTASPANVKILIADNPALTNVHAINATSVVGGIAYFQGIPLYNKYYTFSAAP